MKSANHRVGRAALTGIFSAALAVCGLHLWQMSASPLSTVLLGDAEGYNAWARRIAGGDWVGKEVFYQAPLYPYILGVIYAVTGADFRLVFFLQALLHATSCLLLAMAAARFASRPAAIVAGMMLALYPPAIFHVGLLEKSTLDIFLTCLALWLLSVAIDNDSVRWWGLLGAVLGALTLSRENSAVFLLALLFWMAVRRRKGWSKWAMRSGVLVAGFALLLLPVVLRNYAVGGGLYLTTSQFGPNFYIGNSPQATGLYQPLLPNRSHMRFERRDATDLAQQALGRPLSPAEVSRYWTQRAWSYIRSHPVAWLQLMARKGALSCNRIEAMDTVDQYSAAQCSWPLWLLTPIWTFGTLAPLAALGFWTTWKARAQWAPIYLMVAGYGLSLLAFYIMARYRLPAVPLLILLASAGVTQAISRWRGSTRFSKVVLFVLLGLVLVVVSWPLLDVPTMRASTHFNCGTALQSADRLEEAASQYELAIRWKPNDPEGYNNLGVVWQQMGRASDAIAQHEMAAALKPDFEDAEVNWGNALQILGRSEEAIAHYEAAVRIDPNDADVHNNWGNVLQSQGRMDEAIAHYLVALRLNPDSPDTHNNLGIALARQGRPREAIQSFQRALQLKPDFTSASHNLARAQQELEQQR